MEFRFKVSGIDSLLKKFDSLPAVQEAATVSALNKLGAQGVTQAKRTITSIYNIKSSDVYNARDKQNSAIQVINARKFGYGRESRQFVIINARGSGIPLMDFGALPQTPASQKGIPIHRRKTATVKILKASGRRPVTRDKYTDRLPFVQKMKSGHVGIFTPIDRGGRKIEELYSIGVAKMFMKGGQQALRKLLAEKGKAVFENELRFFMERELKKK